MGCYGIGVTRLMGVVAELFCDEKGLIWPQEIAPFTVHLIVLGNNVKVEADKLYETLQKANVAVLYDDRDSSSAGEKFADSDLIGIPMRVVLSDKTIDQKKVEVKYRASQKIELIFIDQLISYINVR